MMYQLEMGTCVAVALKGLGLRLVQNIRLSGTGEPGGLPSMGSHRVGHD